MATLRDRIKRLEARFRINVPPVAQVVTEWMEPGPDGPVPWGVERAWPLEPGKPIEFWTAPDIPEPLPEAPDPAAIERYKTLIASLAPVRFPHAS